MRKFINIIEHKIEYNLENFPKILKDEYEISDYISSIASSYVDHEFMLEFFKGSYAKLELVNLKNIEPGPDENHLINPKNISKFSKMDFSKIPPIVIQDGIIIDGTHRYKIALQKNIDNIPAYVILSK